MRTCSLAVTALGEVTVSTKAKGMQEIPGQLSCPRHCISRSFKRHAMVKQGDGLAVLFCHSHFVARVTLGLP